MSGALVGGRVGSASFGQERLWFANQLEPGSPVYNVIAVIRLDHSIDRSVVLAALARVVDRHETLRTAFRVEGSSLVQVVEPSVPVEVSELDLRGLEPAVRDERFDRSCAEDAARAIPLDSAPLWRARLVRHPESGWILVVIAHHAIFDATSRLRLDDELNELCAAAAEGRPAHLPELEIQYLDFVAWQRHRLTGAALEAGLAFWRERLDGLPAVHELPLDRRRPPSVDYGGAEVEFAIPGDLCERVRALGSQERATSFMVFLAAYAALVRRVSGQTDLAIGIPVAGRDEPRLEPLIGMLVNTVVLRIDVSGDPTFGELVGRVRGTMLDAWEHRETPLQHLVEALAPKRDPGVPPLYQLAFNQLPSESVVTEPRFGTAREELLLEICEPNARLSYRTALFDAATMETLARQYVQLLEAAVAVPSARLDRLQLSGPAERALVLDGWNATDAPFPDGATVAELIARQAAATPEAVAVTGAGGTLRYAELRNRAVALAGRLRELGVGRGQLVGVALPRSPELVVAVLGVLEAGAAYVPLDPAYPPDRLAFMLADSGAPVVVTSASLRDELPVEDVAVVCVDEPAAGSPAAPASGAGPDDLAYVIYTSGSTGRPKGAMIEHRSLVNYVHWFVERFGIGPDDRVLASSSPSFDAFGIELFPALAAGGTIVMAPPAGVLEPEALLRQIADERVTVLPTVPTVLRLLADRPGLATCPSLRQVVCGGEQLAGELVARLADRLPVQLHNVYGPTEATIDVSCHTCAPGDAGAAAVPIGRPLANTRLYVLGAEGEPAPLNVPGHLHAAGVAVGRGYWGRPAETAAAFVPDPFGPPGSRLYRTGDLVRWGTDGELRFMGRIDQQVKVRGLRIELGEIEAVLRDQLGVRDAVAAVREDAPGDERLVAYVVPEPYGAPTADLLRAALQDALPEHMVPSAFVTLDAIPLTPNGKVDRRALPAPERRPASRPYVAPRTSGEELVASIWAEVLGLERVGALDNFFDLGGHSLLALSVMGRLSAAVELEVPIHALFGEPTVEALAAELERLLVADLEQLSDAEAERLAVEERA
jgi:amino acid adenylation domain-containing protein